MQIVALSLEKRMGRNVQENIEVARGGAERSGIAVAGHTHARAGVPARRNAHVERLGALHAPLAAARAARGPQAAGSRAARAGNIEAHPDRKSTRLNSSHSQISYAVFCLKKKKN